MYVPRSYSPPWVDKLETYKVRARAHHEQCSNSMPSTHNSAVAQWHTECTMPKIMRNCVHHAQSCTLCTIMYIVRNRVQRTQSCTIKNLYFVHCCGMGTKWRMYVFRGEDINSPIEIKSMASGRMIQKYNKETDEVFLSRRLLMPLWIHHSNCH